MIADSSIRASSSSKFNEQTIFKVHSGLPVFWVGEYSIVGKKILSSYKPSVHKLNI
jgi:hypothetical protein